jgi:hypothetical protein
MRIILQPEERALLLVVKAGLYPPGHEEHPLVLRLMALGMLDADDGHLQTTLLAEAALGRPILKLR